jgi:hypothetical protein
MSRISDLIESEARAGEQATDTPALDLPQGVRVTRGHDRGRVLQVRLNEDEYRILSKLADDRGLPVSTLARAVLLEVIGQ